MQRVVKDTGASPLGHAGVPFPTGPACFFLDFDGTLAEFAPTPDTVTIAPGLTDLLHELQQTLGGALAIVTGRALDNIDRNLAPCCLPTAGYHGAVRRAFDGTVHGTTVPAPWLATLRAPLQRHVAAIPGLLLEDKGLALAMHFRGAPHAAVATRELLRRLCACLPGDLELLEGEAVIEVRPAACHKGSAVDAFLAELPFAGRVPLYIGDDVTDQRGMAAVLRHGGMAIAVGDRLDARWRLPTPAAVRDWLAGYVAARVRA
jgi:trehalose 6-phosphate phosphatase